MADDVWSIDECGGGCVERIERRRRCAVGATEVSDEVARCCCGMGCTVDDGVCQQPHS